MILSLAWFRRFCIVNVPLVATGLLTLSLLLILLLVVAKGMAHFSVKPIYQVTHPAFASTVLAMVEQRGENQSTLHWFNPIDKELQSTQIELGATT